VKSCYFIKLSEYSIAIADLCDYYSLGRIITRINVPEAARGNGHGRALMQQILNDADQERITLFLEPAATGGLTQDELTAWYQRHGFVYWKGLLRRKPHRAPKL
jgi:predicted GNAT family N-acyltransferase